MFQSIAFFAMLLSAVPGSATLQSAGPSYDVSLIPPKADLRRTCGTRGRCLGLVLWANQAPED